TPTGRSTGSVSRKTRKISRSTSSRRSRTVGWHCWRSSGSACSSRRTRGPARWRIWQHIWRIYGTRTSGMFLSRSIEVNSSIDRSWLSFVSVKPLISPCKIHTVNPLSRN
ncbi:unnamed protein product, partial [Linum tenue]